MTKKKMGSAAPEKQQQKRKDPFECYTVKKMPETVVERSLGKVKCGKDAENAVRSIFGGVQMGHTEWCVNNSDSLVGLAMLMENENFMTFKNLKRLEVRLEATVSVKAVGKNLWLVTAYWLDESKFRK